MNFTASRTFSHFITLLSFVRFFAWFSCVSFVPYKTNQINTLIILCEEERT